MKVLYVHFGDQWIRGSEQVLLDLLSRRSEAGIEPVVWTNVAPLAERVAELGIPVERDDFEVYFDYDSPRFSPRAFAGRIGRGVALVRRVGAEVIHCNSAAPLQWCLPVSWRTGKPVLVHLHAPYLRRSRLVTGLALADRVIAVTEATLAECRRDGIDPARLGVICNGVDPHRLRSVAPIDLRARLGLAAEDTVIAIIGSLVRHKGHDVLFAAFERLAPRYPHLHLAVIGGGPDAAALHAAAARESRIHFLGETANVGGYLQGGIAALVVPSRREAAGLVIGEAALFAIPSIGSRVGGIPEMISDGETGLLVPVEDPATLAEAIARLIEDEALRQRLGAAARQRFDQMFDVGRMTAAFAADYDALVRGGAGGLAALPARAFAARRLLTG